MCIEIQTSLFHFLYRTYRHISSVCVSSFRNHRLICPRGGWTLNFYILPCRMDSSPDSSFCKGCGQRWVSSLYRSCLKCRERQRKCREREQIRRRSVPQPGTGILFSLIGFITFRRSFFNFSCIQFNIFSL